MTPEILKIVGQVAGVAGVALGVFLILFRDVIRKSIFPRLTKEQGFRLLTLVLVLVWSVALAGIAAWLWVSLSQKDSSGSSKIDKQIMSLGLYEQVTKLRQSLWAAPLRYDGTPIIEYKNVNIDTLRWPRPNKSVVQNIIMLSDIDPGSVIKALAPLLYDSDAIVSSGALLAIRGVLINYAKQDIRIRLLELLPRGSIDKSPLNLRCANLAEEDLRVFKDTEIFYGADCQNADFSGANLEGLNFKTANLNGAQLKQACLAGTAFTDAKLEHTTLWGAQASNAIFHLAWLKHTDFSCHERRDKFGTVTAYPPCNLEGAVFNTARLYGTNLSCARLGGATFLGASISNVDFRGSFLNGMYKGITAEYIQKQNPAFVEESLFDENPQKLAN
jgi:hypothetical protein